MKKIINGEFSILPYHKLNLRWLEGKDKPPSHRRGCGCLFFLFGVSVCSFYIMNNYLYNKVFVQRHLQ